MASEKGVLEVPVELVESVVVFAVESVVLLLLLDEEKRLPAPLLFTDIDV